MTGSVTGTGNYAGGLCGYNNTGIISECYSTGVVTSINGGGLVGQSSSGVIKNSFWDIQTSGRTTSAGGTGLSSAEMKETFYYSVNGWGGEVWTLDVGNDYPHLTLENAGDSFIADPTITMAGSGSVEDPWVIASKEDFLVVCSGTFFWDKHYLLNTDVDLAGTTYSRGVLGYDKNHSFTGSFEGNGYIIRNLTIEGGANLGLFGYLDQEALITNLCVENVSVTGTGNYVGGLCGSNNTGTVSGCYVTGSVTGTGNYVGGLVGCNSGTLSESYSTNAVTGNYAGGLCGYNNTGIISECYSTGVVTSINGGGLVGQSSSGVIKNSFWDIQTSGRTTSAGGTGLSSAEMKETFYYSVNGWGGEVWTLDVGNDYPHLTLENAGDSFIADPTITMAGSGSVEDPWVIASKEDFLVVCSGTFFWDKHYLLNTDVDLAGTTYSRGVLGYDKDHSFTGSFEGNGYIIRNLTIEGGRTSVSLDIWIRRL